MSLRQWVVGAATVVSLGSAQAADVVLAETFNNVAGLSTAGWVFTNNSPSPAVAWSQGNQFNFATNQTAAAGPDNSFAAASYLSTSALTGAVSNWMITPTVMLNSASEMVFFVRNAGDGFLDKLEVRFSSNGSSSNVGSTASSVGDFTMLLKSYSSSSDNGWLGLTYTFASLPAGTTTGRIGFRYLVGDVAVDGNYLGVDSLVVTGVAAAVPEPMSAVLMMLGLTGVWLVRRRSQ